MTDHDFILAPPSVQVQIKPDQTYTMLNSAMMLNYVDRYSGLHPWLEQTAARLAPDRLYRNKLVLDGLFGVIIPTSAYDRFTDYMHDLASQDAATLQAKAIHKYSHYLNKADAPDDLLADADKFVHGLLDHMKARGLPDDFDLDAEITFLRDVYDLLRDPGRMQQMVIEHLEWMWDNVLAQEWQRVKPMLEESAAAYDAQDYQDLTPRAAIKAITGRDLPDVKGDNLNQAERLIFIPSPHMGPYLGIFPDDATVRIIFGARLPDGTKRPSSVLGRSELLVRLNALADDNRLRMLELIRQEGEICAQDIITRLELSQSAASRHLRQLSATGYLIERTRQGAKCYTLNPERVVQTMQALRQFLGS